MRSSRQDRGTTGSGGSGGVAVGTPSYASSLLVLVIVLGAILALLFRDSFRPEMALFANDGPLGAVEWICKQGWTGFTGVWADLNWLGLNGGSSPLGITSSLAFLLGARGFINFFPALMSLGLGLSAWLFFRQLRFEPIVCVLGGIAAALNSDFFSYACWGLGTLTLCVAWVFLALAALVSPFKKSWVGPVLAGGALGCALIEGFDNGAIFSLYIAAAAVFGAWTESKGSGALARGGKGALRTSIIAIVAAIVAAQVLWTTARLVLNSNPTTGGAPNQELKEQEDWIYATTWSLPPKESMRTIIAGLYGYRMDSPGGGQYWGNVGMHPAWDAYWSSEPRDPSKMPRGYSLRYSGAGHYAGVFVVLFAMFAVAQSFSGERSGLRIQERRWVWFWSSVAVLSLLLAFGRFTPLYKYTIYSLPYFHTIRNPVKYLHPFNVALVILFGYGVQALWRGWIKASLPDFPGIGETSRKWWKRATRWERRWTFATLAIVGVVFLGWLIYGSARGSLVRHLSEVMPQGTDIEAIARTSQKEVGLFAVMLAASVALIVLSLTGWFSGNRARFLGLSLGVLLTLDLARANSPWIVHYNWQERYSTNPVFDVLRRAPQEARVTGNVPVSAPGQAAQLQRILGDVYGGEWIQHQFRFYGIQSLDIVQMPRTPPDVEAFQRAMKGNPVREWELSNTRYSLTLAPFVDGINQLFDPEQRRFRPHTTFSLSQTSSGAIQAHLDSNGPFALVEFTGALPRASLYEHWRAGVSDADSLNFLSSTNFNPRTEVLVADAIEAGAAAPSVSGTTTGTVGYVTYTPKRFVLRCEVKAPSILLVNDKYDPDWRVIVDGREEKLLRANYIMRAVHLPPGSHEVEFRFSPSTTPLWISAAAMMACLLTCAYVCCFRDGQSVSRNSA